MSTQITVTREKNYNIRSHPGRQWVWSYIYSIDDGPQLQYGPGLDELRRLVRRKYPQAEVLETWH